MDMDAALDSKPVPDEPDDVAVPCSEPAQCEGYLARTKPIITCLDPATVAGGVGFALHIYGQHLATGPMNDAIVTVSPRVPNSGPAFNGVPASACHMVVQVPAGQLRTLGVNFVVISPGDAPDSDPAPLDVQ